MKIKNRRFVLGFIVIGILLMLSYVSKDSELDTVLEDSNERRMQTKQLENVDYSSYIQKFSTTELGISSEQLAFLEPALSEALIQSTKDVTIRKEDAISDIKFLFEVLEDSYAGYLYFGNRERWEDAEKNVINQINAYPDTVPVFVLQQMLVKNLEFVQDGHFLINAESPLKRSVYYYSEEFEIQKDLKGFYLHLDDHKWYIEAVEGDTNVEQYVRESLDQSGHLCNYIGILSVKPCTEVSLKLKSGTRCKQINIELKKSEGKVHNKDSYLGDCRVQNINDISVFTMDSFSDNSHLENYKNTAKQAKREECIILDLRGNTGGQTMLPATWFQNFSGKSPQTDHIGIRMASLLNNYVTKAALELIEYESLTPYFQKLYRTEVDISSESENQYYVTTTQKEYLPNDTIIFVLIDKNVASSAEWFVEALDTLENVIFVGTNTSGCMFSKQSIRCRLPYSGIEVIYGDAISIGSIREGTGFEPDVWVGGNDVLERVVDFIGNNSIR